MKFDGGIFHVINVQSWSHFKPIWLGFQAEQPDVVEVTQADSQKSQGPVLALPLPHSVTVDKQLPLSGPQYL